MKKVAKKLRKLKEFKAEVHKALKAQDYQALIDIQSSILRHRFDLEAIDQFGTSVDFVIDGIHAMRLSKGGGELKRNGVTIAPLTWNNAYHFLNNHHEIHKAQVSYEKDPYEVNY